MEIKKISTADNSIFKKTTENNQTKEIKKEVKDGNKKLYFALAGLATIGAAAVTITHFIKKGKANKAVETGQEVVNEINGKINGLTKGVDIPFDKKPKEIATTIQVKGEGKNATYKTYQNEKITNAKYYGKYNGKDVIVEEKLTAMPGCGIGPYAFIRDKETNELITAKKLDFDGEEMPFLKKPEKGGMIKTKIQENGAEKTFKNGELYSTKTTTINPDGSKRIVVDYGKKYTPTIIEIDAKGNRSVIQEKKHRVYSC